MSRLQISLCAILAIAFTSCKESKSGAKMPPLSVEVTTISQERVCDKITIASQVEGQYSAVIQPRVTGFLSSIEYSGGEPVSKGDLLFVIDPSQLSTSLYSARAEKESATASEVLAKRNYERAIPLAKIDAISQSDLDQYRATYRAAQANTKSAEESLRSAELSVGYTKIYSPIDGIASKCTATEGDYIGIGTLQSELTTISYTDTVVVALPIPTAKYLKYLSKENKETFDNSALLSDIVMILPDSSIYKYQGEYYYTEKDTPSSSSSIVIVVKFPNPEQELKPGMFTRITTSIGSPQTKMLVPIKAISQLQGINSLWIVKADSTVEMRRVKLGEQYNNMWAIESGVTTDERVLLTGQLKMHDGAKVTPTTQK